MNADEAIRKVHSVANELYQKVNGDRDALQRALNERRETDPEYAEAVFEYELFHKICDESTRH
jgi:hypothetical protein